MTLPRAVLFDIDGTLADTEADGHRPAYNQAFAEQGLDWHWPTELYRELLEVAGGRERLGHYLETYDPPLGAHAHDVAADRRGWIEALHRCKSRHFRRRLERGEVSLRTGVARLLAECAAAELDVALVTNASRATLEPFVDHVLGETLAAGVDLYLCSDDGPRKKPAPDLYLEACRRLGHPPPDCIAVEDSATGLAAAHAAGVPALITVNADTAHQDFSRAVAVLDGLGEAESPLVIHRSPGFVFDRVDVSVIQRLHAASRAAGG